MNSTIDPERESFRRLELFVCSGPKKPVPQQMFTCDARSGRSWWWSRRLWNPQALEGSKSHSDELDLLEGPR